MRTINEIIIHCSATEEGKNYHASDIDRWHKQRGFKKIGYHFVIDIDGKIERGRRLYEVGAHCEGHNKNSIGICYIGGLRNGKPADTRTEAQKVALEIVIASLCTMFPNVDRICGHNDYSSKACPCFNVQREYGEFLLPDSGLSNVSM